MKKQVADDYYDLYITQLVFRKFREGIKVIKQEFEIKWKKAINYYEWYVVMLFCMVVKSKNKGVRSINAPSTKLERKFSYRQTVVCMQFHTISHTTEAEA